MRSVCDKILVSVNIVAYYLKGYVQGYGNYNELITSGIDTKELFDNTDDTEDLESSIFPNTG